ncbi:MAG: membrane protein insertion efficiency factor YidD [Patescibacteria group bacterium]
MLIRYSRFFVIKLLKLYQRTLSFDHGVFKFLFPQGYCRFRPTCSDYAIAAIEKYGVIKGGIKAIWRVLRCNPFNPGGWDPLK